MNAIALQKKEEKESTGKKEAEEEKRQATDLGESECCPFAVVQRAAR